MLNGRENLKVRVFLAHGNLTHVTGYQALSPASSALVPHVQMSFLGRTHPVRWYHLPVLAAGPGLGLLSLCSLYHYHSPFLMQSTPFTQSGVLWPEGPAQTLWTWGPCSNLTSAPVQIPGARWFLVGAWHPKGRSVRPPSPSACSSSDSSCGLLQRHIILLAALPTPSTRWPSWGLHYCLPDPVLCLILPARLLVPTSQAQASVTPALRFIQVSLAVQTPGLKH